MASGVDRRASVRAAGIELEGAKIFRNSSGLDRAFVGRLFSKSHLSLPLALLLSLVINHCLLRHSAGQDSAGRGLCE